MTTKMVSWRQVSKQSATAPNHSEIKMGRGSAKTASKNREVQKSVSKTEYSDIKNS